MPVTLALSDDWLTGLRQRFLLPHLRRGMTSLEIGAFARPTLVAPDFAARFLDFYSTAELREQCHQAGLDPAAVMQVDYVVRGEDYTSVVDQRFDIVVANHVMEHIANPIRWLNMIASLTRPGGYLFIALPEKRVSFDRFRDETSLAHILADYLIEGRDLVAEHSLETHLYYDRQYIGQERSIEISLAPEKVRDALGAHHPGVHCHVFGGASFPDKILRPIIHMRLIPWSLAAYLAETPAGEFYALLQLAPGESGLTSDAFFSNLAG